MQVVLVHGAWTDSRCWQLLEASWPKDRSNLVTIDLPSVRGRGTLEEDADALVALANNLDEELSIIGHSYGGAVVTRAAARIPRLLGVVYLAAFRPMVGASVTDTSRLAAQRTELDSAISLVGDQLILNPDLASGALYGTCSSEIISEAMATFHAQPRSTFSEPLASDVPESAPTSYVICLRDRAVAPDIQWLMAERCDESMTLDCSHSPHLEFPDMTAKELSRIVSDYGANSR